MLLSKKIRQNVPEGIPLDLSLSQLEWKAILASFSLHSGP